MASSNSILGGNGGFHHVCVKTRIWDQTMRFYQETLGFTPKLSWREAPQRAVILDSGNSNYVEVFEDMNYTGASNGAILHFALRTTQIEAVCERLRAAGTRITMEPKSVNLQSTNGLGVVPIKVCFCEGPNGEVIELFQNELT